MKLKIFIVLCLFIFASSQNITSVQDSVSYPDEIPGRFTFHYFKFTPKDSQDISVEAAPQDEATIPVIYVSTTKQYPDHMDSDWMSTSYGYNLLAIPKENVTAGRDIYIAVECLSIRCLYNFKVLTTPEIVIEANTIQHIIFKKEGTAIIKFKIPKLADVTHVLMYAQIVNPYAINKTIHMYVNKGETPPRSSTHDLISRESWLDSKAVLVYSTERFFCTDCIYTALIEADIGTELKVSARTYTGVNNITLYSKLYDAVNFYNNVTYFLDLTVYNIVNKTISITFDTYEGYSQLYINPDTLPTALDQYQWQIKDLGLLRFVLTAREREEANITKGLYITVFGITPTTYQLHSYMNDDTAPFIDLGYEEIGYASFEEVTRYSIWANKEESYNLTLIGKVLSGQVAVYVKSCGKTYCSISDTEIAQNKNKALPTKTVNSTFFIGANITTSVMAELRFYHNGSECSGNVHVGVFETCTYAIAVVGLGKPDNHYTLLANQEKTPTRLKEGQPMHASVQHTGYEYFSFTVTNGTGIKSIRFVTTAISGQVYTYLSRTNMRPSENDYDQAMYSTYSLVYPPTSGTHVDFTGTYYIAVYGWTASTFTMTVSIERKPIDNSTNITSTPIQLRLGQPQRVALEGAAPALFYFSSDIPMWYDGTLEFAVIPIKGTFDLFINSNGPFPKEGDAQWVGEYNQVSLNVSDRAFNFQAQYQIAVYPTGNSAESGSSFIMMVSLSKESIYLFSNTPHQDYVNYETPLFFVVGYYEGDGDLLFTKHSGSDEFEIYLSLDQNNPYPTEKNYDLSTATHHSSLLVVNASYLNSACGFSVGSYAGPCVIYGAARTNSSWWISVSLLLSYENQTVTLTEGEELAFPILSQRPLLFTFEPNSIADGVTIMAFSYHQKIALVANVVKSPITLSSFLFPTLNSYDFMAKSKGIGYFDFSNTIKLQKSNFTGCLPKECALALAVYPQEVQGNATWKEIDSAEGFIPEFNILATSTIIPLTIGQSVEGNVWEGSYVYYSITVTQPVCKLYISLTAISQGDPDIVVSFGATQRPTIEGDNYDFSSLTDRSDQIEISNKDILPERVSMEGTWVIGVYGCTDVTYRLSVMYEDSQILLLQQGVPFEFLLQADKMVYFKFYHYFPQDIKIRLTREFGFGNIYVNRVLDSEEMYDHLPNASNHQWSTFTSNTRDHIEISREDANFCRHCYYLIQVKATEQNMKFVITVMLSGEPVVLQAGKGLRDYVKPNEANIYSYANVWGKQVDINLIIYSGEITVDYSGEAYKGDLTNLTGVNTLSSTGKPYLNLKILPADPNREYMIRVVGKSMANYTILANSEDRINWLTDGVLQYGYLNPNAQDTYQFFCDQSYSTHRRLKIVVNVYNDEFSLRFAGWNATGLPEVSVTYRDSLSTRTNSTPMAPVLLRNDTTVNGMTSSVRVSELIQYAVQNGTWTIQVKNNENFLLNYSIVAKTKDIYVIPLNTVHLTRIGVREFDIFEVYIYEKGILAIEVLQCYGRVVFSATSSIEKLNENDFDLEIRTPYEDLLYGELEVDAGIIYIKVRAIEGIRDDDMDPTQEALFKIETRFFKTTEVRPYEAFFAGEDGRVTWAANNKGIIDLQWKHLGLGMDHEKAKTLFDQYNVIYKYKIVWAKDNLVADTVAKCDWVPQKFEGYFHEKSQFINSSEIYLPTLTSQQDFNTYAEQSHNFSFAVNETGPYYVQIIAMAYGIKGESAVWQVPIMYKNTEIITSFSIVQIPEFWAIVGGISVLILGFLVYRYYKKYRIVKQRLNFELQEVRLGNNVIEAQSDFVPSDATKGIELQSKGPSNNSQYQDFAEEEKTEL